MNMKMYILIFLLLMFLPVQSYAFSSVMLLDPAFLHFMYFTVPLAGGIVMAASETLLIGYVLRPSWWVKLAFYMVVANLFAFLFIILLSVAIIYLVGPTLMEAPAVLSWGTFVYFALIFLYVSHKSKIKMVSDLGEEFDRQKMRKTIFFANILSHLGLYTYLALRLF